MGVFTLTTIVSSIVTFQSTNYSAATDKSIFFYGSFHPCIFFDHCPAKIPASVGISLMILVSVCFHVLVMLFECAGKQIFHAAPAGIVAGLMIVAELTNLYPLPSPTVGSWSKKRGRQYSLVERGFGWGQPDLEFHSGDRLSHPLLRLVSGRARGLFLSPGDNCTPV